MRGVRALVVGGDEGPAALRLPAGDAACTLRGAGCVQARLLPAMGRASWPGRRGSPGWRDRPTGLSQGRAAPLSGRGCAVPGPGLMRSGAAVARSPDQRYRVLCERAGRATTPARAGHERPQLAMEPRVFVPPCRDGIPPAPFGDAVVCGRAIFDHAGRYARSFVGGALSGATVIRERTEGAPGRCGRRSPSSRDPGGPVTTLAARIPVPFGQRENGRLPP